MTRVMLDTNIVLDVLCNRSPFVTAASALWKKAENGEVEASLAATTLTTIFYIVEKQQGSTAALQAVVLLLQTFAVCTVDRGLLQAAAVKPMSDYEDAVLEVAAETAGIPIIVTRDANGFLGSSRRIMDAETLLKELAGPVP